MAFSPLVLWLWCSGSGALALWLWLWLWRSGGPGEVEPVMLEIWKGIPYYTYLICAYYFRI
ncbi:hypothetical protein F4820DRAFT_450917 [Hypoxylon rubiginosum]|uniref:Uncharacterized protein n=1 Tax=Hypoxylon rubiginosum TaxID=110542 RepID=A0ACB9YU99_9PEZI|nr:hypothetical protein F4820DRAFT_450917 [Hypoxylon rubiginosum]